MDWLTWAIGGSVFSRLHRLGVLTRNKEADISFQWWCGVNSEGEIMQRKQLFLLFYVLVDKLLRWARKEKSGLISSKKQKQRNRCTSFRLMHFFMYNRRTVREGSSKGVAAMRRKMAAIKTHCKKSKRLTAKIVTPSSSFIMLCVDYFPVIAFFSPSLLFLSWLLLFREKSPPRARKMSLCPSSVEWRPIWKWESWDCPMSARVVYSICWLRRAQLPRTTLFAPSTLMSPDALFLIRDSTFFVTCGKYICMKYWYNKYEGWHIDCRSITHCKVGCIVSHIKVTPLQDSRLLAYHWHRGSDSWSFWGCWSRECLFVAHPSGGRLVPRGAGFRQPGGGACGRFGGK